MIDVTDLRMIMAQYGHPNVEFDVNDDGMVNIQELLLVLSGFGRPIPAPVGPPALTTADINKKQIREKILGKKLILLKIFRPLVDSDTIATGHIDTLTALTSTTLEPMELAELGGQLNALETMEVAYGLKSVYLENSASGDLQGTSKTTTFTSLMQCQVDLVKYEDVNTAVSLPIRMGDPYTPFGYLPNDVKEEEFCNFEDGVFLAHQDSERIDPLANLASRQMYTTARGGGGNASLTFCQSSNQLQLPVVSPGLNFTEYTTYLATQMGVDPTNSVFTTWQNQLSNSVLQGESTKLFLVEDTSSTSFNSTNMTNPLLMRLTMPGGADLTTVGSSFAGILIGIYGLSSDGRAYTTPIVSSPTYDKTKIVESGYKNMAKLGYLVQKIMKGTDNLMPEQYDAFSNLRYNRFDSTFTSVPSIADTRNKQCQESGKDMLELTLLDMSQIDTIFEIIDPQVLFTSGYSFSPDGKSITTPADTSIAVDNNRKTYRAIDQNNTIIIPPVTQGRKFAITVGMPKTGCENYITHIESYGCDFNDLVPGGADNKCCMHIGQHTDFGCDIDANFPSAEANTINEYLTSCLTPATAPAGPPAGPPARPPPAPPAPPAPGTQPGATRTCGDAPSFLTCNTGTVKPDATVMSTNNFQNDCCCLGMSDTLTTNINLGNIRTCGDYAQYMRDDTGVVDQFIANAGAAGVTECCGWNPTTGFQ